MIAETGAAGLWPAPFVTEVKPLEKFWPAEAGHDDDFNRNPGTGYCRAVVAPKVLKFRKHFAHLRKVAA